MPGKIKFYLLFFLYFISVNIYSQSSEILVDKSYIPKLTKIYGLTANQLLKNEVNDNLLFLDASKSRLEQLKANNVKYSVLNKMTIKSPQGTSLKNGTPEIINFYFANGNKLETDQVVTIYLKGKNIGSYSADDGYLTLSLPDFGDVIDYGSTLKHSAKVAKDGTMFTSSGTTSPAQYVFIDGYQTGWYSGEEGVVWGKVKLYKSGRYYVHGKMNIGNARYPASGQGYSGDQQGWPVVRKSFDVKAPIHNDFWITNQHLSTYNATPGQHLTAYCYINYKGNSSSTLNPSVRCYLSKDKNLSGDDIPLGYEYSSLSSSSTRKYLRISNTIHKNTNPGNYYFLFKADDGNRIKEDNENNNVAYRTLTIKNANYTVSGNVHSDQNSFDVIKDAKVTIDGNSSLSCKTDENGNYVIKNVPAGNHNITVSNNDYQFNHSSATIDVNKNLTWNFTGHCRGIPSVTYEVPKDFVPGKPFTITVKIENDNYSVSNTPVFLDVSFPDFINTQNVKFKENNGFDNGYPKYYEQNKEIFDVVQRKSVPAQYLLWTGLCSSGLRHAETHSYSLTVTPPDKDKLRIYVKGSIGDQRDPTSGTIGQQGVWEKVITLNKLQSYTVSGNVHSDQNNFDVIKDAKVTIDGNSSLSCKTDENGNYVIKNVPAGNHNITVSNNDYQFTHSSASINVNKNLTQDFTGHCRGIPAVTYEVPKDFVPGKPFTITVKIENNNYSVSNAPVFLDVSFPDFTTTKNVKFKENNGFDNGYPKYYEQNKEIFDVVQRKSVPAQYLLWTGLCSSGLSFDHTHSYSLTITPPDKDKLRIYIKGSIGDQRDPTSGTIGQQGVWEKVITLNKLQNYTVSGNVHSDQNNFDVIKDAKVTIDGNSNLSCKTDENGNYVIKNVPAGNHNITVSNNDYQFTHSSATIDVNKNLTQDFTGHCRGIPSVTYEVPKDFVPGKPFTITVKIENDNYSVSNAPVFLDVSFPDFITTKNVKLKENNGFDNGYPKYYEQNKEIFDVVQRKSIHAQYLLWTGLCSSGLRHAETHSYSLTVTPPDKDKLRIYIKGSIGDNRYPLQSAFDNSREVKGQQGVYEEVVTINKKKEYPAINIPVLMYHNVDDEAKSEYWVSTKNFKDQMNYLKSYGYNTITLNDILVYINTGKPLPDKPVVLSFDDGYENLYTKAYPILKKLNFKAISFLITDYIGNTESDRKINSWDPDEDERKYKNKHLIWPEIKEMAGNGISFGAHTKTHPYLTKVSAAELKEQVEGSKQAITAKLGKCDFFCYPFGDINDQVEDEVKNAGYLAATDIDKGRFFNTRTSDLYRIERLYIPGNMDINAFARKINPNIQFPKLDILGVQFYDENNQPKNDFSKGEKVIIKIRVKNTGPTVKSVVSLNLDADDDDNTAPLYDSHLTNPTGDKVVTLTSGEEKTIEFEWQMPQNTTVKQWYYNIGFHGEHYCLWYGGTNWTKGFVTNVWGTPDIELTLYRVSGTDGTINTDDPGTETQYFIPGETVRVTLKAVNTGNSVPVQCVLNIFGPDGKIVYDSHQAGTDNSTISPLGTNQTGYYSFDWVVPQDLNENGNFSIGASVRNKENFNVVYETTRPGANTTSFSDGWILPEIFKINKGAILLVPYSYQDETGWCALNSMTMLLKYYGIDRKPWVIAHDPMFYLTEDKGPVFWLIAEYDGTPGAERARKYLEKTIPNSNVSKKIFYLWINTNTSTKHERIRDYIINKISENKPLIIASSKIGHASVVVGADANKIIINDPSGAWFNSAPKVINVTKSWKDFFSSIYPNLAGSELLDVIAVESGPSPSPTRNGSLSIFSYIYDDKIQKSENTPSIYFEDNENNKPHRLALTFDGSKDNANKYGYRFTPIKHDPNHFSYMIPDKNNTWFSKNSIVGYSAGLDDVIKLGLIRIYNVGQSRDYTLKTSLIYLDNNGNPLMTKVNFPVHNFSISKDNIGITTTQDYLFSKDDNHSFYPITLAELLDPDGDGKQNNPSGRYEIKFLLTHNNTGVDSANFQFFVKNKKYAGIKVTKLKPKQDFILGKKYDIPFSITNYGNMGNDAPIIEIKNFAHFDIKIFKADNNFNKTGSEIKAIYHKDFNIHFQTPAIIRNETKNFVIELTPKSTTGINSSFGADIFIYSDINKIIKYHYSFDYTIIDKFLVNSTFNTLPNQWFSVNKPLDIDFSTNHTISSIQYQIDGNKATGPWHNLTTDGVTPITKYTGSAFTGNWMISRSDWENLHLNAQTQGWHYIYFRVKDQNGDVYITPSQKEAFKFGQDIYKPTCFLTYPSKNQVISTSSVTLKWYVSDVTIGFPMSGIKHIYYSLDDAQHFTEADKTKTSATINNLSNGNHMAYIYAVDNANNKSDVAALKFVVNTNLNPPAGFGLKQPKNGTTLTDRAPRFEWQGSSSPGGGNITYELWYGYDPTFKSKTVISNLTTTSYTPTDKLDDNSTVYWRVKAVDNAGLITWCNNINWSFIVNVENDAPSGFDLREPQKGKTLSTDIPHFNWNRSTDPDPGDKVTYHLLVSTQKDFNTFDEYTTDNNEFSPTGSFKANTLYYWKVKATDKHNGETWSNETDWWFTLPNHHPVLEWDNNPGFDTIGLEPYRGNSNTTFEFRVKYKDTDGDAPENGYPKLHVFADNTEIQNSPFTMEEYDNNPFTSGRVYRYSLSNLDPDKNYSFYFEANDTHKGIATGAPTNKHYGPMLKHNSSTLSGHLTYACSSKTPLSQVSVSLTSSDKQTEEVATTDNTGLYTFTGLPDGDYTLKPDVKLPWGGVSAIDITLYKQMIIQALSASSFLKQSGDVDKSGSLSTMDLTFIKQRIVQIITAFNSGDWLYNNTSVTLNGNDVEQDVQALCYGDADGSYVVNTTGNKSVLSKSFQPVFIGNGDLKPLTDNGSIVVPFILNKPVNELSSVTLIMKYPSDVLQVAKVEMAANNKDLLYNAKNGTIRLVYSTLQPLNLETGDTLMKVWVKPRKNISTKGINREPVTFSGVGEFGDYDGNVLKGIKLYYSKMDLLQLKKYGGENKINIYPNPAKTRITVTGVDRAQVQVFDIYGKCIYTATPDSYKLIINLQSYPPGTYTLRVIKEGKLTYKKFVVLSN